MTSKVGVLVMAYGTPAGLDDVEAYYTHIRGGRAPSREDLKELVGRYRAIGGRSPLTEITRAQAHGIAQRIGQTKTYVGFKHCAPFVADAVGQMKNDEVERAVGVVLAPHYSALSIGDYERRASAAAADLGWTGTLTMVESWHLEPGFIELLSVRVTDALAALPESARAGAEVVFTAHSLPAKIVAQGDPYAEQLRETAHAVATRAGLKRYRTAWQSAGRTADEWLGPDLLDVVGELAAAGTSGMVVCPCGFVADHLEVLYDIDVEASRAATRLGIPLVRTRSPNDDPALCDLLAAVVGRKLIEGSHVHD